MHNLWDDHEARQFADSDLAMRVYTSRLLGREPSLVLHGGGNTSVKSTRTNLFGEEEEILYVKGSGWDLKTIEEAGFAPTRLRILQRLGGLPAMTDTQMARELKASMVDPAAPAPSVEAILHALIPLKFVDHTHTDAVVAISNTPRGEELLGDLFGESVLVLPYVMPGFILAKQVHEATRDVDWSKLEGIVLLHHGLFTFADDARASYDAMIRLVTRAEDFLKRERAFDRLAAGEYVPSTDDHLQLTRARRRASELHGHPMLAHWKLDERSVGYAQLENIPDIACRGPVTPDHTLQTKRTPAIFDQDCVEGVDRFGDDYLRYFARHDDGTLACLDPAPRFAVWVGKGCVAFGPDPKRTGIVSDIVDHTVKAVQWGEALGGWRALSEQEIFDIEYWELEQAKLKRAPARKLFAGRVALITGAASGIGKACAEAFLAQGAAVVALDIDDRVEELFARTGALGLVCDVTSEASLKAAVQACVRRFGGIDVVVSNAGNFPTSRAIEELDAETLDRSMRLNFGSHATLLRECIPFLKLGFEPSVILVASKNVPAPGPGAAAYSAAKAALTQMGRVAAMELGGHGIRVNMLHPNAVFDTGLWSGEVLEQRAGHYGLSVDEYRSKNLLGREITAAHVGELAVALAGPAFARTTGAQIPIDGGNERVI
jgi:rhamnose utilization protein RhaD (predicted bifunctional aldolase and dehydrogenase)/NAD(P)-dependent dehydrogenase (short-subunit alcohol dehydrogenase family)